jgi:hypothetical protein
VGEEVRNKIENEGWTGGLYDNSKLGKKRGGRRERERETLGYLGVVLRFGFPFWGCFWFRL